MIGPVQCPMCGGIINKDLQALCGRAICTSCATAIAQAIPLLKTQPCRRQTICMRLAELDLAVMPTRQEVRDLAEWGVSDEQLMGACDIAKERGKFSFGYVYSILKNERETNIMRAAMRQMPPAGYTVDSPGDIRTGPPVRAKEEWERQGFANQADYEAWQFAYDKDRRSGRRITEAEHRRNWLSPAI